MYTIQQGKTGKSSAMLGIGDDPMRKHVTNHGQQVNRCRLCFYNVSVVPVYNGGLTKALYTLHYSAALLHRATEQCGLYCLLA
jgi:hypothetical protein